jgi:hypothetical protein
MDQRSFQNFGNCRQIDLFDTKRWPSSVSAKTSQAAGLIRLHRKTRAEERRLVHLDNEGTHIGCVGVMVGIEVLSSVLTKVWVKASNFSQCRTKQAVG